VKDALAKVGPRLNSFTINSQAGSGTGLAPILDDETRVVYGRFLGAVQREVERVRQGREYIGTLPLVEAMFPHTSIIGDGCRETPCLHPWDERPDILICEAVHDLTSAVTTGAHIELSRTEPIRRRAIASIGQELRGGPVIPWPRQQLTVIDEVCLAETLTPFGFQPNSTP
jgi:hypothetical protein